MEFRLATKRKSSDKEFENDEQGAKKPKSIFDKINEVKDDYTAIPEDGPKVYV